MGIEELKLNFVSYLKKKDSQVAESLNFKDTSTIIQENSEEFKSFLVNECGYDSSIFTKSLDEIAQMDNHSSNEEKLAELEELNFDEIVLEAESEQEEQIKSLEEEIFSDGQQEIINPFDESNQSPIEEIETISSEIVVENIGIIPEPEAQNEVQENEGTTEEFTDGAVKESKYDKEVQKLLDKLYDNKTALKALDEDGDGELSLEEKEKFEEFIKGYDDSEELTELAVKRAYEDIKNGDFSYDNDLEERIEELEEKKDKKAKNKEKTKELNKAQNSGGATSVGGGGGSIGASGGAGAASQASATVDTKPSLSEQIAELEAQRSDYESDLSSKEEELNELSSGETDELKTAKEEVEKTQEAYDKAVEEDEKISEEIKTQREENLTQIAQKEESINKTQVEINNKEAEIFKQETTITQIESSIDALNASLATLESQTTDNEEKQAEIDSNIAKLKNEIATQEKELTAQKEALSKTKEEKQKLEETLSKEKEELVGLEEKRAEIEEKIADNCSPETKTALEAFQTAKDNEEQAKADSEKKVETVKNDIATLRDNISQINQKINELKAQQTQEEYKVSDYDFDFEENMTEQQKADLETFKQNFEANKDKYEKVEEATGFPAELVAAIHWRESSGDFSTYLHNGQPLGQVTTIVPEGIYFEDWTEAAIDAMTNHGTDSIDMDDINTWYEYAECYNGYGYRNQGLPSPYVWAGTSEYSSGKYVRDGVFDPNAVDSQLGVAVMLKAILE